MKKEVPMQLIVALMILLVGGLFIGGEYFLVKWLPYRRQKVEEGLLNQLPYHNDALGIDAQVAAAIDGKVESFSGGVKIYRPRFWGTGPSLTITSEPNVDHSAEFSADALAKWETDGTIHSIPGYHYEQTKISGHDAVLIQQLKNGAILVTARLISPEHIILAECSTGSANDATLAEACDETLRSLKLMGSELPVTGQPSLEPVSPAGATAPRVIQPH